MTPSREISRHHTYMVEIIDNNDINKFIPYSMKS